MEWEPRVSVGDWLRERVDDPWRGTMHDAVPRGFSAYARVLHPATRSKPVGRDWPPFPQERHRRAWDAFAETRPEIETRAARWADAAAAFGTTLHPLAQWTALTRAGDPVAGSESRHALSADGWQFDAPTPGDLDADVLAAVAAHLTGGRPTAGHVAIWTGWGGLLGHLGTTPPRPFLGSESGGAGPQQQRNRHMLAASTADPFNRPYATETWQPGILPGDVSRGAFLELPGREFVLFRGDLAQFADRDWQQDVPWADRELAELGFAQYAHSPGIMWPLDRSWVLVTEVDWDSTVIGGPPALVDALCADPAIEAEPVLAGSSLLWDADEVNR